MTEESNPSSLFYTCIQANDVLGLVIFPAMDFYHVLPSNVSPDHFPNNNASYFSTPLDKAHSMTGNWEVALMDLTYSTCINTFNNDSIVFKESCSLVDCINVSKRSYKVLLPIPTDMNPDGARVEIIKQINKAFKSLLQVSMTNDKKHCNWTLETDDYYFILSPAYENLFHLWSDVITPMDSAFTNYRNFRSQPVPTQQSECYICIVPVGENKHDKFTDFILKAENEKIDPEELLKRFRKRIPKNIATLAMAKTKHFILNKVTNDNFLLCVNAPLCKALTFRNAALFRKNYLRFYPYDFKDTAYEWKVTLIAFKDIPVFKDEYIRNITLPPRSFAKESNAITFLNKAISDNRIEFSCNSENHIGLTITDKNVSLSFDDNLRDILGFEQNACCGNRSFTSRKRFSLTRCIQFLYIYSNICTNVHVGNTKSPLLAIVPFSNKGGCSLMTEKKFRKPMYISVSKIRINQIDVGIYDGAGELVPFIDDALTTLRLHFRQI